MKPLDFIAIVCIVFYCLARPAETEAEEQEEQVNLEFLNEPRYLDVQVTVYNAVSEQTDEDPLITASGAHIDIEKVESGEIRWCAISRDLKGVYEFGDSIDLYIAENHPDNGIWIVNDLMNKRYTNSVDLLKTDKYGKWQGKILQ